jgi:hypothetical protein
MRNRRGGFVAEVYHLEGVSGKAVTGHPEEAPVRRLVHEYFLKYRRIGTVTRLLTEAGHRSRKGKPFSNHGISIMLRDSTPKGLHRANYITYDANTKAWKLKPEFDWVFQEVEPILKAELWDACAAMLEERDASHTPRAKRAVQLFAGVLFCGCGAKMYVPSNTPKYVCQKCRNKIPIGDLEDIFIEQLRDYMLSGQELTAYLEAKDKDLQGKQELLGSLVQEEKALRAEMDKVYRLYMADQITVEGFGERHKPMEERLRALHEETPKIEATVDFLTSVLGQATQEESSPRGTTGENRHRSGQGVLGRPSGTGPIIGMPLPTVETVGYYRMSLRDKSRRNRPSRVHQRFAGLDDSSLRRRNKPEPEVVLLLDDWGWPPRRRPPRSPGISLRGNARDLPFAAEET